jgi:hypothetical protein
VVVHQPIIVVSGWAGRLSDATDFGVVAAGWRAARPVVPMHEAVIVEVTAGGGVGHRRQLQSRIAHTLNTLAAAALQHLRWGGPMNAVKPLTPRFVKLETL